MPRTITQTKDIYSGDSYLFSISPLTLDGVSLPGSTKVEAVIVDGINKEKAKKITSIINLAYDEDSSSWQGLFAESETLKFLSNPEDKGSELLYDSAYLEISANNLTTHIKLKIGRGLI